MSVGVWLSFPPQNAEDLDSHNKVAKAGGQAKNMCLQYVACTLTLSPVLVGFWLSFPPQSGEESQGKGAEASSQAAAQEHGHDLPQPPQK